MLHNSQRDHINRIYRKTQNYDELQIKQITKEMWMVLKNNILKLRKFLKSE